jgi:RHS repeat-associated protein
MDARERVGVGRRASACVNFGALAIVASSVAFLPGLNARAFASVTAPSFAPAVAGVRFSDPPTDEEFLRAAPFAQPLLPVGRTTEEENVALAKAVVAYDEAARRGNVDALGGFADFLARHPRSAWRGALLVDLGAQYRKTGHFSRALATWQEAWDATKDLHDPAGALLADVSVGYLSQLEAYLGRKESLEPLLESVKDRPLGGPAGELLSSSRRGLAEMIHRPEISFLCGPSALKRIAISRRSGDLDVLKEARSTPEGLSLTMVQAVSEQAGMSYQMAFRPAGSRVVLPAVVHWKTGHYAALLARDHAGRLVVADDTFGEDVKMTEATLDDEASGYVLVGPGPLPAGWRSVDATEGSSVWGRGNTGDNYDLGATGCQEIHAFGGGGGGGCSEWDVEAMVVGLSLHDDPVGYTPPLGPRMRFGMDYSQRDQSQPTYFTYSNFGNKWTNEWISYVTADTNCGQNISQTPPEVMALGSSGPAPAPLKPPSPQDDPAGDAGTLGPEPVQDQYCVTLYRRGGGTETYVFTNAYTSAPSVSSVLGPFSQAILTANRSGLSGPVGDAEPVPINTSFVRTLPDGSTETFAQQMGGTNQFFMTAVADPQGNAATINYDSQMRITSIVDAIGQATTWCYNDSVLNGVPGCQAPPQGFAPTTNLQVTYIVDHFGRSATFYYAPSGVTVTNGTVAAAHLVGIRDVLGIMSSYSYGGAPPPAGTPVNPDFIYALTTPYGTTQFTYSEDTSNDTTGERSVTVTDPLGRVSFVQFHQGSSSEGLGSSCNTANAAGLVGAYSADGNHIECTAAATPAGMFVTNGGGSLGGDPHLQFRNTFIWTPEALASQDCIEQWGFPPYPCARLIHWLHENTASNADDFYASRIPESTKAPLQSRVWFNYAGQSLNNWAGMANQSAFAIGLSNQPTAIGRVLEDGSTQLWQYEYNDVGRVTSIIDPAGRQLQLNYADNLTDLLSVMNTTPPSSASAGSCAATPATNDVLVTLDDYNTQHEPQRITSANGQTTRVQYNGYGQVILVTDPLMNAWTYAYSSLNAPLQRNDAGYLTNVRLTSAPSGLAQPVATLPPQVSFGYDGLGRVQSFTDLAGVSYSYAYDAADRPTSVTFPDTTTETFAYTILDLTSVTDRRGNSTMTCLDADREVTARLEIGPLTPSQSYCTGTPPSGRATHLTYWAKGVGVQPASTIADPLGNVTTIDTDDADRTTAVVYADGSTWQYQYDWAGRVDTVMHDPSGTMFVYQYNADNTLQSAQPGTDAATAFVWDPAYRRVTSWAQGALGSGGQVAAPITSGCLSYYPVTPPAMGAGLLKSEQDTTAFRPHPGTGGTSIAAQFATSYGYDALNRVVSRSVTATPGQPAVAETLQYDALGRVKEDDNALDSFTFTYDDSSMRPLSRTSTGGPQLGASYYGTSAEKLLETVTATGPGGETLAQYGYGYDGNYNVTSFSESQAGPSTYGYDAYNQLLTAAAGVGENVYSYDQAGNLLSDSSDLDLGFGPFHGELPLGTTSATYGPVNQITTLSTSRFGSFRGNTSSTATYDGDGDLTSLAGVSYTYDQSDRLLSVTHGTQTSYFDYDGLGRLVQVVDETSGAVTASHQYGWCGGARCAEYDDTVVTKGAPFADKAYFGEGMVTYSQGGLIVRPLLVGGGGDPPFLPGFPRATTTPYYYVADALGSVRQLVDRDEFVQSQYDYDAFGNQTRTGPVAGEESDFGFAGYFNHAPSGLAFARNRAYSASLARWLTRDPVGSGFAFEGGTRFNATDLNLYGYSDNNPASLRDPSGNCPWCIGIIVVGIVGGFGAWAPSDTAQAPANVGALMGVTSAGFGALGAVGGAGASCAAGVAETEAFSPSELAVVNEVRGMSLDQLRAAFEAGGAELNIGGRTIIVQPGAPFSGMTLFGENGFVLGDEAFASDAELTQTLLQETYRLSTSQAAGGVSQALATAETADAAGFAQRAYEALFGQ